MIEPCTIVVMTRTQDRRPERRAACTIVVKTKTEKRGIARKRWVRSPA